jgi:iron only hydrogenase large subunit-like protein
MSDAYINDGTVLISAVDDYLAPSQACVNPLFIAAGKEKSVESAKASSTPEGTVISRSRRLGRARINHESHEDKSHDQPLSYSSETDTVVPATLVDCLACSGCVTTAETVLMEQQHSLIKMEQDLGLFSTQQPSSKRRVVFITISPASWADLFRHFGFSFNHVGSDNAVTKLDEYRKWQRQLTSLWHQVVQCSSSEVESRRVAVIDGFLPLQWSLQLAADEFCLAYRKRKLRQGENCPVPIEEQWEASLIPSVPISRSQAKYRINDSEIKLHTYGGSTDLQPRVRQQLPLITSSCPALVCLAEKTIHGVVPHLSKVKSPMALAGAAAWAAHLKKPADNSCDPVSAGDESEIGSDYYHIAIMPCHDKKLEANRLDLHHAVTATSDHPDIDIALTTSECMVLFEKWFRNRTPHAANSGSMSLLRQYVESLPLAEARETPDAEDLFVDTKAVDNTGRTSFYDSLVHPQECVLFSSMDSVAHELCAPACADREEETDPSHRQRRRIENASLLAARSPTSEADSGPSVFSSGGYADFVFRYAAMKLFGVDVHKVTWQPVSPVGGATRNVRGVAVSARVAAASKLRAKRDLCETILYRRTDGTLYCSGDFDSSEDEAVLRFAVAYGMQTLQRVLSPFQKQISHGADTPLTEPANGGVSSPYDYIEAMACPAGCLNGGGQLRVSERESPSETHRRVSHTRGVYESGYLKLKGAQRSHAVLADKRPSSLCYTRFHAIPPLQYTMGAAAGVAVKDTQW